MALYQIANEMKVFLDRLDAGEIPEEAVDDTFDLIDMEFSEKVEAIACAIKNKLSLAKEIAAEIDTFRERKKRLEATAESMKNYIARTMQYLGYDRVETKDCAVKFSKSSGLVVEDEWELIKYLEKNGKDDAIKYAAPTVDKNRLRELIKCGEEIPFCHMEERKNLQIK